MPGTEAHIFRKVQHLYARAPPGLQQPFARAVRRGVIHQIQRKLRFLRVLQQALRRLYSFFIAAVCDNAGAHLCFFHAVPSLFRAQAPRGAALYLLFIIPYILNIFNAHAYFPQAAYKLGNSRAPSSGAHGKRGYAPLSA